MVAPISAAAMIINLLSEKLRNNRKKTKAHQTMGFLLEKDGENRKSEEKQRTAGFSETTTSDPVVVLVCIIPYMIPIGSLFLF
jgi:hypothetical protein